MIGQIAQSLEKYMDVLAARQALITSNIANIDTPGYRTVDLNFQQEFQHLLDSGGDVPGAPSEVAGLQIKNDGNNVNMDRELRLLAEDSIRFSAVSTLAQSQLALVKSAIDNLQG
jgi:flagellar basal-body rod protein FlgB